jgi:3-oxoacyl-[acyl-carrier protein] reductase
MMNLNGKTALVSGGSRGIGRAAAMALAGAGCDVAVNYVQRTSEAAAVVEEITKTGRRACAVQADVSLEAEVRKLVDAVEHQLGSVDILVNNAGIGTLRPFAQLTLSDWHETIATNLTSSFLLSQAVIGGMRQRQWGRLIFMSSLAAQIGGVIGPHYAASKAGMLGLMHSYANLLAKEGITSNAIAPALIDTEMIRDNPKVHPALLPVGRFGKVEEIGDVIVLLAGNGYITGQTIHVNGGMYMT